MKKIFPVILLLFLAVFTAYADQTDNTAEEKTAEPLRIGVYTGNFPFAFYDQDNDLTGIDIEMLTKITECMGVDADIFEMASESLIDSVRKGQSDVIGGAFSVLSSRRTIDFTKTYYSTGGVFVSLSDLELAEPLAPESFAGNRIGVQKGTGFEAWLKDVFVEKDVVPAGDIYTFVRIDDAMRSLNRGKIDLVLMDANVYLSRFDSDPAYRIWPYGSSEDNYAFGIRKNSGLKDELDRCLSELLSDGTAQNIADRFFNAEYPGEMPLISRTATPTPTPTALPTPTPPVIPTAEVSVVQPTACNYSMAYVADITIPDGQQISPAGYFTKIWRVRNDGTCIWTPDFLFSFVSGTQMGGQTQFLGQTVNPGEAVDLSVNMIAPFEPGDYQSDWQLKTAQGYDLGDPVWVRITVPGLFATPTAGPEPTQDYGPVQPSVKPVISWFYPSFLMQPAGSCVTLYWGLSAFSTAELFVDGKSVYFGPEESNIIEVCDEVQAKGQHNIELCAYSAGANTCDTILYTAY